jgi:ABC-type polysaccharide transport system permease subunit
MDWITLPLLLPLLLLLLLLQVSAAFALVLRSFGLLINSVGGETQLDLASYTFSGGHAHCWYRICCIRV